MYLCILSHVFKKTCYAAKTLVEMVPLLQGIVDCLESRQNRGVQEHREMPEFMPGLKLAIKGTASRLYETEWENEESYILILLLGSYNPRFGRHYLRRVVP